MKKKDKSNGKNIYVVAFIENFSYFDYLTYKTLDRLVKKTTLDGKYSVEHFDLKINAFLLNNEENENYFKVIKNATHYDNILYYDPNTKLKVNSFIFNQYHWDRIKQNEKKQ